jgi:hypothetical protein
MANPIITSASVVARLPAKTYTTLFARDGGATVDTTFRDRMIAATNSAIHVWCKGAFPSGLVADGATVDPIFEEWAFDVLCYLSASKHPNGSSGAAAYKDAYTNARMEFTKLTRGQDPGPMTSGTAAVPTSQAASFVEVTEGATVWTDFADGRSGFG